MRRYSIYEAKAKFSEVVREALASGVVVVTHNGTPVVEIVPYSGRSVSTPDLLDRLEKEGGFQRAKGRISKAIKSQVKSKPGALERFLRDRE
jgi:prevent-host-death family protein